MTELPKTFDPAEIEARWYAHWEREGLFRPARDEAEPWTIVMPPPNVTGSLHIGHALDVTLQDVLTRHARLQGKDALWVAGMDHAGIATQMVVERNLAERQQKRTDFTREEFVAKVWEWKAESGGAITRQLRRLGASCDWANERFTMDEGFCRAVAKVFVELYNRKLLYRDKRLVNWDPGLRTAISDLEVETNDIASSFWHFSYPLEDGSGAVSVATTRPETMLADMAVAVNPDDARYTGLIGRKVRLPITGRLVPIIADEHADPELGSGAVKITPGHDFNDFEVGKRAGFKPAEMLNMLDQEARIVQTSDGLIPEELIGLDRFEARTRVVAMIEAEGRLEKVEDRVVATPYGDRSGVVIEPWLTDQWYVDAATLAKKPIEAVRSGDIRIVPRTWEKTWFNWLENIQPWCVSRQLWWGHRIPAWYCASKEATEREIARLASANPGDEIDLEFFGSVFNREHIIVASDEDAARTAAAEYFEVDEDKVNFAPDSYQLSDVVPYTLERDKDVLDTWFSSALWPFATLGWPDDMEPTLSPAGRGQGEGAPTSVETLEDRTPSPQPSPPRGEGAKWVAKPGSNLARHYPNDVLISGFDIIFFWDARMAMMGFQFMGEKPWKTLYLHGLVRDAQGAKMSKSKGNTVDPLGLIDRYGADALRFTLAAMESQGRDIKLDEKRVEGYRNFATKLWNAARFCQANGIGASAAIEPPAADLPVNRWIIGETVKTVQTLDIALAELRYDESANIIYHFVWATFCDWYLELIKPLLSSLPLDGGDGQVRIAPRSEAMPGGHGDLPMGGGGLDDALSAGGESTPPPTPPHQGEGSDAAETREVAAWVLDQILVVLHPFMPFVTEELWGALGNRKRELIVSHWPVPDATSLDPAADEEINWLIRLVDGVRTARAELGISPGAKLRLIHRDASGDTQNRIDRNTNAIMRLARVHAPEFAMGWAGSAAQIVVGEATFMLPLEGVIDIAAERTRLTKAAEAAEKERDALAARLDNPSFLERAKLEAVEKARADHAEKSSDAEKYRAALARLG